METESINNFVFDSKSKTKKSNEFLFSYQDKNLIIKNLDLLKNENKQNKNLVMILGKNRFLEKGEKIYHLIFAKKCIKNKEQM